MKKFIINNEGLLTYVGKNVSIKYNGRYYKGVLEKWVEHGGNYYSFNIRNVLRNIHWWNVESIKEVK